MTAGQRVVNGQKPVAELEDVRHPSRDPAHVTRLGADSRHRGQEPLGVGMPGTGEEGADRGGLDDVAGVHHHHPVADLGHGRDVMGDQQNGQPLLGGQSAQQRQDLCLHGDVQGRRRLVGDQEIWLPGEGHGDHDALRHAAGELMRIVIQAGAGIGQVDLLQQRDRLLLAPPAAAVRADDIDQLLADGEDGVEVAARILKDHRQAVAAYPLHRSLVCRGQVDPIEVDRSRAGCASSLRGDA